MFSKMYLNAMGVRAPQGPKYTSAMNVSDPDILEREGTADLENDPRFFTENVIDKRLEAFEALAIVAELISCVAVEQCFELTSDYANTGGKIHVDIIQICGFFGMILVMFLATVAAAVLSLQLFYTMRLMTAGPTGFDKASRFYQDSCMWRWRERAIFGVKWSLVLFMFSTGLLLYVRFYIEGAPSVEKMTRKQKGKEYQEHQLMASVVWFVFMVLAGIIATLVRASQRTFDACYTSLDSCHNELNRHLVSNRV